MKKLAVLWVVLIGLIIGGSVYSVAFAEQYVFLRKWGTAGIEDGQFNQPQNLVVDSNNVIVADFANHRIQEFDRDGNFIRQWGSYCDVNAPDNHCVDPDGTGPFELGDGQFAYPSDVAVDSFHNVYVVDHFNYRIQKFDNSGNFITKWGSPGSQDGQFRTPYAIAIDHSDNVYVADFLNHRIQKFTKAGIFITKWGSQGNGDGEFRNPRGVAVDSDNNVYVVDGTNQRVQKFDSNGGFKSKWGSYCPLPNGGGPGPEDRCIDPDGTGPFSAGDGQFNEPFGIDVDSSNNVYVADSGNHRIEKFDSNGNFITKWGLQGSEDGQFNNPRGIATDGSSRVYVADTDNNRIQIFSPVNHGSDTVPPDTTIISSVDGNNKNIDNGSLSSSNSITFNFAGTDNVGIQGFKCKLDQNNIENCTNPKSYSNLLDGKHTFSVFALDTSSNEDSTPAILEWTIDTVKPVVTVPSDISVNATGSSGAVVTFSASANDNVDGSLKAICNPTSGSMFPIGSTQVTCSASDKAGNTGSASFNVLVKEPPKPTTEITLLSLAIKSNRAVVTGGDFSLTGRLSDGSTGRKLVGGQEISFTIEPTGIFSIPNVKTDPSGKFSLSKLKAPNTEGDYKITAHFSGNQFLLPSDSNPILLKVEKKGTSLTLLVKGSLNSGASLSGSLTDLSTHKGISSLSVSFTTSNPDVSVKDVITDSKGKYTVYLNPINCGTQSIQIQSHFTGSDAYKPSDSSTLVLRPAKCVPSHPVLPSTEVDTNSSKG